MVPVEEPYETLMSDCAELLALAADAAGGRRSAGAGGRRTLSWSLNA